MQSDRYTHPEFGCLAPTPRLRRELRIALFSMLFGLGIGMVAVTAVTVGGRDPDSRLVSPVVSRDVVAAPAVTPPAAGGGDYQDLDAAENQCQ